MKQTDVFLCRGKGGGKGGKEVVIIADEPPEEAVCGCAAVSLASKAICQTAATVKDIPIYEHIARLKYGEVILFKTLHM